jgi:hypothetical protein
MLLNQLMQLNDLADESPEDRLERLETAAERSGASPETLYETERRVESLILHLLQQRSDDVEDLREKGQAQGGLVAALSNMLSPEAIARLGAVMTTMSPRLTVGAVRTLAAILEDVGLADEVDAPPALVEPDRDD